MFTINNGRLMHDGGDISDAMSAEELKAQGDTLLLYAKFKSSVEKAAELCFGPAKKRKAPTKKKVAESTTITLDDGMKINSTTGEIYENMGASQDPNTGEVF